MTGIGIAAPTGLGPTQFLRATLRGDTGIRAITRFDTSGYWAELGGEVPHFEADRDLEGKLLPQTDHMTDSPSLPQTGRCAAPGYGRTTSLTAGWPPSQLPPQAVTNSGNGRCRSCGTKVPTM